MFRPAKRENTPLIVGIAGPTKSGKTYSAHRLAKGLCAPGKHVAMVNAEGARGHQYADEFDYIACDIKPPYRPTAYEEPLIELLRRNDIGAVIVDSMSHMHDGPGGMLEWHDELAKKMAKRGTKSEAEYEAKLERVTWAAWIEPKAGENSFVYRLLELACPVILCFRAKEKLKIVPGKQPIDLGWQPISSDRVAFETLFTLVLPPHSKGVPDLSISEMRKPFDTLVPAGKPIDEELGGKLRAWSAGAAGGEGDELITEDEVYQLSARCAEWNIAEASLKKAAGVERFGQIKRKDFARATAWLDAAVQRRKEAQQDG